MQLWLDELKASITDIAELRKVLTLTKEEEDAFMRGEHINFRITPHILKLIKNNDKNGKIRKQFIPSTHDVPCLPNFEDDYLCEANNEVCENLVVRYPYKAILLVTKKCPAYCQFCTRKRIIGENLHQNNLSAAFEYLKSHPEIYDIVITGGDPLILEDSKLEYVFDRIRKIKSIKFVRLNTRVPVTLPKRINKDLIELFVKYNINYINIHFEHPDELSDETVEACNLLANNGILLGSQSVLLNQVNNDKETLKELFLKLLSAKVRPYYLYQCDKVNGCQSFYVSPNEGIMLINSILWELPGISIPRFVIDAPDKMGKITVAPNGLLNHKDRCIQLKNFNSGDEYIYNF